MTKNLSVADLFCGVGGLSLGFQKAGFSIELAADNWDEALEVYSKNFKHNLVKVDLSDVNESVSLISALHVDGIIGGPPCQDFSHAGKRKEGLRADLTKCFSEIVTRVQPKFFVMENVERTLKSRAYVSARNTFVENDYGLTEIVLDASLCGVPQKRKRFFCIGLLGEADHVLMPIIEKSLSKRHMTMRDYFKNSLNAEYYYRHPRNYSRRGVYSLDEPSATIRGVNRPIPPNYPGHVSDAADIRDARPLTTGERAQVQTFPNSFHWVGTKTNVEQMIGNAVPVNLAKFVANCVLTFFR